MQALIEQQAAHVSRLLTAASERLRVDAELQAPAGQISDMAAVIDVAVRDCRPGMELRFQRLILDVPAGPIAVVGDADRSAHLLVNAGRKGYKPIWLKNPANII